MSEMYNEIMELFGSCQEKSVRLAEQLIEGQGIDKTDFMKHFGVDELIKGNRSINSRETWREFVYHCSVANMIVFANKPIDAIRHLTGLRYFTWSGIDPRKDAVSLAPLSGLSYLEHIDIVYGYDYWTDNKKAYLSPENQIDLSPLAGLSQLTKLDIQKLNVRDISVIAKLPNLKQLYVGGCVRIKSFKPLMACKKLDTFQYSYPWFEIRNNPFLQNSFDTKIQKEMVPTGCFAWCVHHDTEHMYIDKPRQPRIAKRKLCKIAIGENTKSI